MFSVLARQTQPELCPPLYCCKTTCIKPVSFARCNSSPTELFTTVFQGEPNATLVSVEWGQEPAFKISSEKRGVCREDQSPACSWKEPTTAACGTRSTRERAEEQEEWTPAGESPPARSPSTETRQRPHPLSTRTREHVEQ